MTDTHKIKHKNIDSDAYQTFAKRVLNEYRFVLDDESIAFQAMLKETVKKRELTISTSETFFRARKGYDKIEDAWFLPYPIDSMLSPPPDKACAGRVNPMGIPCLYAADEFKTAIMELRPWIGELVSVASFNSYKKLNVVDLTADNEMSIKLKICLNKALPRSEAEIEKQIWSELNNAFSEPISINDQTAKYAPTQIISEWFKSWGYDGVAYKSSVHVSGKNYAFFDPSLFSDYSEVGQSQVVRVGGVDISHHSANTILTVYENKDRS